MSRARDDVLVTYLAAGLSVRQAAEKAGCSERTVYRRKECPEFNRRVDAARAETASQTAGQLGLLAQKGCSVLAQLADSESERVRLRAAEVSLQYFYRAYEVQVLQRQNQELEERLAALEEQVAERERSRKRDGVPLIGGNGRHEPD